MEMSSTVSAGNALSHLEENIYSTSAVSSTTNIPKPNINESPGTPLQNSIVNKFLSLGKQDTSYSSESSSSVSSTPSTDSPVKLRDLPHSNTLSGCIAFVDVWSFGGTDNRSSVFRNCLIRLGATVCKKFTKEHEITHVVFKDGHKSVLQKAQKRNIKIVTCLWVDRCRALQKWVNEDEYLFDPTSYKPPKRFYEMQPLDPEESMRRSAERMKRRKARHAKKTARIMFQSPLVTHNYSGTPKDYSIPTNGLEKPGNKMLVADTPYQPRSPFLLFNPSIVFETPLSDSMKRKMQRLKEGKPVFSPPSSEDESEDKPNLLSPGRPTESSSSVTNPEAEMDESGPNSFSPVADTQHPNKNLRRSGILPPEFDISCDEIPETQSPLEGHLVAQSQSDNAVSPPPTESSSNKTVHLHEDMELTKVKHVILMSTDVNLTSSVPCASNETSLNSMPMSISNSSSTSLKLHISGNSSVSCDESGSTNDASACNGQSIKSPGGQAEEVLNSKPVKPTSKRRVRRLLTHDEYVEPVSLLISPKSSVLESGSPKCNSLDKTSQNSVCLPQVGCSAYKTLTQSGRFFQPLSSVTRSESSLMSSDPASPFRHGLQSTDYEYTNQQGNNDSFCLYDRIKMRKRSISSDKGGVTPTFQSSFSKKRRRKASESCKGSNSKVLKLDSNRNKVLFCSQAAISILNSLKKRRSSNEFTTSMSCKNGEKLRKKKPWKRVIVLTNLHSDERLEVHKSVRTLNHFRISSTVREQTSHVVCGAPRRTMNVLRAIARGTWLLSKDWVTDSYSAGYWLEEESYEMPNLFPTAKKNRMSKFRNSMWRNTVFEEVKGHIYVTDDTRPPQDELKELITLCGGSVVGSPRRASLCIGNPERIIPLIPVVNETWVIDCICEDKLLPYTSYLIE